MTFLEEFGVGVGIFVSLSFAMNIVDRIRTRRASTKKDRSEMSGPSVSTEDSRQDYTTPNEFMVAVSKRFGPISFDLAAHAGNAKHERYFAPEFFFEIGTAEELRIDKHKLPLGVSFKRKSKKGDVYERKTKNVDEKAYGIDAFNHSWADLSKKFGEEHPSGKALLWLNCEWANSDHWSERCKREADEGANILLLTHIAISNWYAHNVAGIADVNHLLGRMSFDGKNVYPKDCMLSWYSPKSTGSINLWDWRRNEIIRTWVLGGNPK